MTSSPPESVRLADLDWTFVTSGLPDAVSAARQRAEAASAEQRRGPRRRPHGRRRHRRLGAAAGLVDVLSLHLAPVVLGGGTPLFTGGAPRSLVQRSVLATSTATHLLYDVG